MHSRRAFLRVAFGSGAALFILSACGQQTSPTTVPATKSAVATQPGAAATKPAAATASPAAAATTPAAAATKPAAATTPGATTTSAAAAKPAGAATAELKGTKVHLLNWSSFVPEEDTWFKETLVNEWAKPNGVELTIELVGGNDVQPKVTAAIQANAGPDIVQQQWTWAHLFADKLTDVSDLAERIGQQGGGWYEAAKQNNFVQGTWRAVPFALIGNAFAYRMSWLKEGTGADKTPETWEEFGDMAAAVKQKTGTFAGQALGHSFGDPPTFVYPFLWSYGGAETDESGKQVTINSAETEAALSAFKGWFEKGSDPQCLSWDDSSNNRAYLAGQIWTALNGASIYVAATKQAQDIAEDTNHFLNPKGPKGQFVLVYPIAFAVPTYVQNPAPAYALLEHIMSTKTFGEFMKAGKGYTLAPYKKGESELWPGGDPKFDPYKQAGQLSKWYGYPASPSPAAATSGSKYIIVDMFAKVAQGESTQSAMQWAEGELKNVYK